MTCAFSDFYLGTWDPNAAAALELDEKARVAARLLTAQVRDEAACS